ncbi:phasin family protein [Caldanaerobius polysaccharolyticus]|uniref:phasin family protein n=1 Tax=Caldanaerobius polysaccharolyticus TaxID=44256 RepID=UPI000478FDCB|nr:hypothetical protein [Caldanaerobius polysaccharolyticus]
MLKDIMLAGIGLVSLTKDKAQEIASELVKRGEIAKNDENAFVNRMMKSAEEQSQKLKERISEEIEKLIKSSNVVTRSEFEELKQRVEALEKRIEQNQ